jgi:hypothetical protein
VERRRIGVNYDGTAWPTLGGDGASSEEYDSDWLEPDAESGDETSGGEEDQDDQVDTNGGWTSMDVGAEVPALSAEVR